MLFCMRVMVGVIILYDHVHPVGAFAKTSKIDVRQSSVISHTAHWPHNVYGPWTWQQICVIYFRRDCRQGSYLWFKFKQYNIIVDLSVLYGGTV